MQTEPSISVAAYFALEAASEIRHEYRDGWLLARVGLSLRHSQIKDNTCWAVRDALAGRPCRVVTSDLRVKVSPTRYRYPDVIVLCREPEIFPMPGAGDTLANPEILVEVLSDSTKEEDRVTKYDEYTALPSLQEYWIIAQDEPRVIQHTRQGDAWVARSLRGPGATLRSSYLAVEIPLEEFYRLVAFDA